MHGFKCWFLDLNQVATPFFSTLVLEASGILPSPHVGWAHNGKPNPPLHSGSNKSRNRETPWGGGVSRIASAHIGNSTRDRDARLRLLLDKLAMPIYFSNPKSTLTHVCQTRYPDGDHPQLPKFHLLLRSNGLVSPTSRPIHIAYDVLSTPENFLSTISM